MRLIYKFLFHLVKNEFVIHEYFLKKFFDKNKINPKNYSSLYTFIQSILIIA